MGYGITSGIWDLVFPTQYPKPVRKLLSEKDRGTRIRKMTRFQALQLFRDRFKKTMTRETTLRDQDELN